MPFSTACNTPLSNFESHQNYKVSQYTCALYVAISFFYCLNFGFGKLVFFAWWYISILLHFKLIAKNQVNGLLLIIFRCSYSDHLILAFFLILFGYYLQIYKVHTLFYSDKLLSLPLWALKMSIALCWVSMVKKMKVLDRVEVFYEGINGNCQRLCLVVEH